MVERETRKFFKCYRSNDGGEYTSMTFRGYCAEHGIQHEKTIPGTSQHNGIAERLNQMIMENVRSILSRGRIAKHILGRSSLHNVIIY